jgi:hypothetical protein
MAAQTDATRVITVTCDKMPVNPWSGGYWEDRGCNGFSGI